MGSSRMRSRPRSGEGAIVAALSRWLPDGRAAGDFARWFAGWARWGVKWLQVDGRTLPQRLAFFVVGLAQASSRAFVRFVHAIGGRGALGYRFAFGRTCLSAAWCVERPEREERTRVPAHHCDLASALVFWFRWRITRACFVHRSTG